MKKIIIWLKPAFSTSIVAASLDYTQQQLVQIEPNELNFEPQDTDNATCFNAI